MRRIHARGLVLGVAALAFLVTGLSGGALWAQTIDHSAGFAANADLTANGNASFAPAVAPTAALLTPNAGNQAGSIWYTTPVSVNTFNNTFTFQFTQGSAPVADGITFTIQNQGVTALGATGMGLGYAGITPSVAITFKTYDGSATPNGYSTMVTNGTNPPVSASVAPLQFFTGDLFQADMTYDGTTLAVTITDTVTKQTFVANYAVNIPAVVGSSTAFVGFTGGTGGANENNLVLTWTYNSLAAPTNLTATDGFDQVTLNWTAVTGAASYNILRSSTSGGPYTQIGTVNAPTVTYTDTTATFPNTYYYVVVAVNGTLTSPISNQATGVPLEPNISATPTTLTVAENGGTAVFTVSLLVNPTANVVVTISSGNPADLTLNAGAGAMGTVTLTFTPGGALSQQVTATGVQLGQEGAPVIVPITFVSVTSTDPNYPASYVPPSISCTIIEDSPAIIVNPASISTVNGGPAVQFTVQLATVPNGNVTLNLSVSNPAYATVAPLQITTAGYNTPVTVTVTPLMVNTQTTYLTSYDIIINSSQSTDPAYAALGNTLVPVFTPTSIPPLSAVWKCGFTGAETFLPLLGLMLWRRRGTGRNGALSVKR